MSAISNTAYSNAKTNKIPVLNNKNTNAALNQKLSRSTNKTAISSAPYLPANTTMDTFYSGHTSSLKNLQKVPKIQFHAKYGQNASSTIFDKFNQQVLHGNPRPLVENLRSRNNDLTMKAKNAIVSQQKSTS